MNLMMKVCSYSQEFTECIKFHSTVPYHNSTNVSMVKESQVRPVVVFFQKTGRASKLFPLMPYSSSTKQLQNLNA